MKEVLRSSNTKHEENYHNYKLLITLQCQDHLTRNPHRLAPEKSTYHHSELWP